MISSWRTKGVFNPSNLAFSGAETRKERRDYSARAAVIQSDSIPSAALRRGWETLNPPELRRSVLWRHERLQSLLEPPTDGAMLAALLLPFVSYDWNPLQPPHIWLFRFHLRGFTRVLPQPVHSPPPPRWPTFHVVWSVLLVDVHGSGTKF